MALTVTYSHHLIQASVFFGGLSQLTLGKQVEFVEREVIR